MCVTSENRSRIAEGWEHYLTSRSGGLFSQRKQYSLNEIFSDLVYLHGQVPFKSLESKVFNTPFNSSVPIGEFMVTPIIYVCTRRALKTQYTVKREDKQALDNACKLMELSATPSWDPTPRLIKALFEALYAHSTD